MGTLASLSTEDVLERVLGSGVPGHGDVHAAMAAASDAAWEVTSPRLLELCRVRIAMLLGAEAEVAARMSVSGVEEGADDDLLAALASWPTDPRFTAADRACLAFTEHWVMDVASLDYDTAADVRACIGDEGLQNFAGALLVVEQRIRLRLVWDRLFGGS